jgi:hypothetical protein
MPETLEEYDVSRPIGTRGKKPKPLAERIKDFRSHIKIHPPDIPDGCDEWQLSVLQSGGYPQFNINGQMRRGHRVMWILERGPIPDGIDVCHKCDNPRCLRIDHLFLGTALVNMHDMISKGRDRHPTGIENGVSSFDEATISLMLALLETKLVSKSQVAKHFGTDRSKVGKISFGRIYKTCTPIPISDFVLALAKAIAARFPHRKRN